MSGPKGGSYKVVETAAQREARLLRDAKADYARAEVLWEAARARLANVGGAAQCPAAPLGDSTVWSRAARALETAAEQTHRDAARAREAAGERAYAGHIAAILEAAPA